MALSPLLSVQRALSCIFKDAAKTNVIYFLASFGTSNCFKLELLRAPESDRLTFGALGAFLKCSCGASDSVLILQRRSSTV